MIINDDGYKFVHGESITCKRGSINIKDAKISIDEGNIYICSNYETLDGAIFTGDYFGYKYSWAITSGLELNSIYDFKSKSNTIVIDGIEFVHGMSITCKIEGEYISNARISLRTNDGTMFICQNLKDGTTVKYKLGYDYSWIVRKSRGLHFANVTDVKIMTEYVIPMDLTKKEFNYGTSSETNYRAIPDVIPVKPRNLRKVIVPRVVPRT
jgi:hypothetical protein